MKCDETKPICLRCIKVELACDGYQPSSLFASAKGRQLLPRSKSPSITPVNGMFESNQEKRYFEIFCDKTAYEILPTLEADVVRLMLLQACESEPCIRHGIVAIGALDKTSQTAQDFERLAWNRREEMEGIGKPKEHYHNALKQYGKALKKLRLAISERKMDLRSTLLASLIIFCFEAWHGSNQLAVEQIQTAIGLIQDWKQRSGAKTRSALDFISPIPSMMEDQLIQIFSQLAIQVVFFAEKRSTETGKIMENQSIPQPAYNMPNAFVSYREAIMYHRNLTRRSSSFLSRSIPQSRSEYAGWIPAKEKRTEDIQFDTDRELLMLNILRWCKAFVTVEASFQDFTTLEWRKVRILRIQSLVTYASLGAMAAQDEMVYDDYNHIHKEIVNLSSQVVSSMRHPKVAKKTNFSFDTGVIIPLYLTVMKCRHPQIRRRIVDLLLSTAWREGVWDSIFVGRMGEWTIEIEEEFLERNSVPAWARISGVTWRIDLQERAAWLTCQQRSSAMSDELRTRTTTILW